MRLFVNDLQLPELSGLPLPSQQFLLKAAYSRLSPAMRWFPTILGLIGCFVGAAVMVFVAKAVLPLVFEMFPAGMNGSLYLSIIGGTIGGSAFCFVGKQVVRVCLRRHLRRLMN
jgi:hypothetical protein